MAAAGVIVFCDVLRMMGVYENMDQELMGRGRCYNFQKRCLSLHTGRQKRGGGFTKRCGQMWQAHALVIEQTVPVLVAQTLP